MGVLLIDDNGISAFIDDNGDAPFVDDLGNFTGAPSTTATTTALVPSANPIAFGSLLTLTATVTPVSGVAVPTGTVTFFDLVTSIGSGSLDGAAQVSMSTNLLSAGAHSLTAVYGGDTNFDGSTSPILSQSVIGTIPGTLVPQACL